MIGTFVLKLQNIYGEYTHKPPFAQSDEIRLFSSKSSLSVLNMVYMPR